MPIQITDDFMSLEIDGRVVATARFSQHAAADGHGAWIVSCRPARLSSRNQAIAALTVADVAALADKLGHDVRAVGQTVWAEVGW